MLITATFTGQDGSLGYRTGERYTLRFAEFTTIIVQRMDGGGVCEYGSTAAFLRNWAGVTRVAPSRAEASSSGPVVVGHGGAGLSALEAAMVRGEKPWLEQAMDIVARSKKEVVPNSEEAPSFEGSPSFRPFRRGGLDVKKAWTDEARELETREMLGQIERSMKRVRELSYAHAVYREEVMLRSLVMGVTGQEPTDELLKRMVHKAEWPDGTIGYYLIDGPPPQKFEEKDLILRRNPIPWLLPRKARAMNTMVVAQWSSPYFVKPEQP